MGEWLCMAEEHTVTQRMSEEDGVPQYSTVNRGNRVFFISIIETWPGNYYLYCLNNFCTV